MPSPDFKSLKRTYMGTKNNKGLILRTFGYLLKYDLKLVILPYSSITNLKTDTFTHRGHEDFTPGNSWTTFTLFERLR